MDRIPKIIHYCWFGGGEKPPIFERCIASWRRVLPEYEIMEWNESKFDVSRVEYVRQAYDCHMYAFVSDYVRLIALKQFGGIYLDTDVEVLKPLDSLLCNQVFLGYEESGGVNPGLIMGSAPQHPFLDELIQYYEKNTFIDKNGCMNTYTTVNNATDVLVKHGLIVNPDKTSNVNGVMVYSKAHFCPDEQARASNSYSEVTFTVHHYAATWRSEEFNRKLQNPSFVFLLNLCAVSGRVMRKILGVERWRALRNGPLKHLYDAVRGLK